MNIIKISKRTNKSRDNESWVDIPELGNEFNLYLDHVEQNRLKSFWLGNWYCTDTRVGYKIYFLDDEAVAVSI